jgi:Rrf2 family protein
MRLTSRSEYALLALLYLARHGTDGYISVETIATAQQIPQKFLEQIMLHLARAHYLRSVKGQHGGYQLARPANEITLAEVIRSLDGPLSPTDSVSKYYYRSTPIEKEPELVKFFAEIRDRILDAMENSTLADFV